MCHNVELALSGFGDFSFFIHLFEYRKQEDNMSHIYIFIHVRHLTQKVRIFDCWPFVLDLYAITFDLIFDCGENSPENILKLLANVWIFECLDFIFGQQQNSLVSHYFVEIHWQIESKAMQAWQVIKARQRRDVQAKFFPSSDFQIENNKHSKTEPPGTEAAQLAAKQKRQTFRLSQAWPGLTSSLRLAVSPCIGV